MRLLSYIRSLKARSKGSAAVAAATPPSPQRSDYLIDSSWLHAWVNHHIRVQQARPHPPAAGLAELPAMHLHASLGYDAALSPNGDVWLSEYDSHPGMELRPPSWRRVGSVEATGIIVVAARRFPELALLLPVRPPSSSDCTACRGSGNYKGIQDFPVPCPECGGLGWGVAPA